MRETEFTARLRSQAAQSGSAVDLAAGRKRRRPVDSMRATWPCRDCTGRGYPVTLRGRGGSCAGCDGTGIDHAAIADELAERSRAQASLARVVDGVEAAIAQLRSLPEGPVRESHSSAAPCTSACASAISEVRAVLATYGRLTLVERAAAS